jgi:hypothetical protein
MKRTVFLSGLLTLALIAPAADLSGTWTGTLPPDRRGNVFDITFKLVQTGEKLTGKMYRDTTSVPILDGKTSGEQISFHVISSDQVGNLFLDIKYLFSGTIKDSEIELTREREFRPELATNNPNRGPQKQTFRLKKLF